MRLKTDHIGRVETHFDKYSKSWHDLYEKPRIANDHVLIDRKNISVEFLCEYLAEGSKILDAGCGTGTASMDAVQKGFIVHGMDISKEMIKRCDRRFSLSKIDPSKYRFTVGDAVEADLSEHSFDGIIALGLLEYQKDEREMLEGFHKLLRAGGILIVTGPINIKISNLFGLATTYFITKERIKNTLKKIIGRGTSTPVNPAAGLSVNKYSLSSIKKLLKPHFTLIDFKRHGYANFFFLRSLKSRNKIEWFLHPALSRVATYLPIDRFANDIVVVARKGRQEGATD